MNWLQTWIKFHTTTHVVLFIVWHFCSHMNNLMIWSIFGFPFFPFLIKHWFYGFAFISQLNKCHNFLTIVKLITLNRYRQMYISFSEIIKYIDTIWKKFIIIGMFMGQNNTNQMKRKSIIRSMAFIEYHYYE